MNKLQAGKMRPKIENRVDVINYFIRKYKYKSYLEIGYLAGETFDAIKCKHKDSVDIDPKTHAKYIMSSDRFFRQCKRKYDLIFIDGNHDQRYVGRDIRNALKHWAKKGTIVLHDCNPPTARWQAWNGTVWRAILYLRRRCEWLVIRTIDIDHGIGIIRRGYTKRYLKEIKTFEDFDAERKYVLRLITPNQFLRLY